MKLSLAFAKTGAALIPAAVAVAGIVGASPVSLLPPDTAERISAKKPGLFEFLPAVGDTSAGFVARTANAADPVWHGGDSSVESAAPVKAGDLLVLSAAVRGASRDGEPKVLFKLQGADWAGLIRSEVAASGEWRWIRCLGRANKDRAAGELRLHVYPAFGCQAFEVRDLRLENWGSAPKESLPPLPDAPPDFGGEPPVPPDAPPSPPPVELRPLSDSERAKPRRVMLKLDDVTARTYRRYDRVLRFLEEKDIVAGFGVVVASLETAPAEYVDWIKSNARENGGRVEFWNHGWDHAMDGRTKIDEFKGSGLVHQREHLARSQDVFRERTGLSMRALGTAGNSWDSDTSKALSERPDIGVWLYGNPRDSAGKTVLKRTFNLEHSVGRISFAKFAEGYARHRLDDYAVLQGHPNMWNDAVFAEFRKVVGQLLADGWTFVTPRDFAAAPALCAYRWGTGGCEKGLYDQWGAWVGEPGIWAEDFMPKESWDKIEGEAWQLGVWSKWRTYAPGRRLVLSVPMLVGPWDRSGPKSGPRAGEPVSLAKGAAGEYDSHFEALGRNLVKWGLADTIVRLGWEFNGGWYTYRAESESEARDFAAFFRRAVEAMRRAEGQEFLFCWNPAMEPWWAYPVEAAWPGDNVVDVIGLDAYDQSWVPDTYPIPADATAEERLARQKRAWDLKTGSESSFGLPWWPAFARRHGGKPIAVCEWGVCHRDDGHGGGDDPLYIERMADFILDPANNVMFHCYFNVGADDGDHLIVPDGKNETRFPESSRAFHRRFARPGTPYVPPPFASPFRKAAKGAQ